MGFMMKPTEERPMAPARRLPWGDSRGRAEDGGGGGDIVVDVGDDGAVVLGESWGIGLVREFVELAESSGGSGTVDGDSAFTESDTTAEGRVAGGIAKYGTPVRYVRIVESE